MGVHITSKIGFGKGGDNTVKYEVVADGTNGTDKEILEGIFGEFVGIGLGLGTESKIAGVNNKDGIDSAHLTEMRNNQKAEEAQVGEVAPIEEELETEVEPPQLAGEEGE